MKFKIKLYSDLKHFVFKFQVSASKISACQVSQSRLENQVKNLEQTVAMMARYIGTTYDKKHELPNDIRKLCQQVQQTDRKTLGVLGQKLGQSFSSKFSSTDFSNNNGFPNSSAFSEESSSDPDDRSEKVTKKPSILKTGLSTPNLFNKDPNKVTQQPKISETEKQALEKKRQYLSMKKSQSCNAGLMVSNKQEVQTVNPVQKLPATFRGYPLKVLDEDSEYDEKMAVNNFEALRSSNFSDASSIGSDVTNLSGDEGRQQRKTSKFFANSHELIRQEKLQAEQLKRDFDDNLRKLDSRLSPNNSTNKKNVVICHPLAGDDVKLALDSRNLSGDSGLGTPVSPPSDKLIPENSFCMKKDDDVVNHPLVGCDVDVKFDVHATKLKSLRPIRFGNPFASRTSSIDSTDSRN